MIRSRFAVRRALARPTPRRPATLPPRVLIISGSVGAGHDGAAAALAAGLSGAGIQVDQRDYLQALPPLVRLLLRGCYPILVNRFPAAFGWLFDRIERDGVVHGVAAIVCRLAQHRVERWTRPGFDVVVSTYPLASQTLGRLRQQTYLNSPVVTFLTDPAAHRLWVHDGVDYHMTVTQATADHGAFRYHRPMRVGGPLVAAAFSRPPDDPAVLQTRAVTRAELGVTDRDTAALILIGSLGLGDVLATVEGLLRTGAAVPIVLCGHNERLRRDLATWNGVRALGWRGDMPDLMAAADVLITNAGGLSFTEALVAGLPAVCFAPIPGHGQANAAVLDAVGLAPWARTPVDLVTAIRAAARVNRAARWAAAPPSIVVDVIAGLCSQSDQQGWEQDCSNVLPARAGTPRQRGLMAPPLAWRAGLNDDDRALT